MGGHPDLGGHYNIWGQIPSPPALLVPHPSKTHSTKYMLLIWGISCFLSLLWASHMAQIVKYLPAIQETWVQSLGWEDPLEKGMATPSSILAWRIPWTEGSGRSQSLGSQRTTLRYTHTLKLSWGIIFRPP